MLILRRLPADEWDRVKPIFEREGHILPSPHFAQIDVAEDEHGTIQGLSVLQFIPHLEPIWVAPTYRGTSLWRRLLRTTLHTLPGGTHVLTSRIRTMGRLSQRLGFTLKGFLYEVVSR